MNKTQKSFNFAEKSGMYDGVITGTGLFGSLVSNVVWKMNNGVSADCKIGRTKGF